MSAYLDLARRGRTAWWSYVVTPVVALAFWAAVIVVIFTGAFIARVIPADFTQYAIDPSHPVYFYGFAGVTFGALAIAFAVAAWVIQGKGFGDIVGPWNWRQFFAGAGLWLVLVAAGAGIDYLVRPSGFRLTLGPQTLGLALIATPCLAAQTFCEEFIFRGYATQGLALASRSPIVTSAVICLGLPIAALLLLTGYVVALKGLPAALSPTFLSEGGTILTLAILAFLLCANPIVAKRRWLFTAISSALIFATFHIPNGVPQAANALVFGFVTALIVMRTTNLAFTWGIHLVNNLFGAVVVVSASDVLHGSPGIFTQATPDLMWLDVAVIVIAFALAWLLVSRLRTPVTDGREAAF